MNHITNLDRCLCCGSSNLTLYLDLKKTPLASAYHKDPHKVSEEYELKVNLCEDCYHSQLSISIDPDVMFSEYLYINSSKTFTFHQEELADYCIKWVPENNRKHPSVLDLACNDGQQLEIFRNKGCYVFGVDPAANLRVLTEEKGISVLVDYWREDIQLYVADSEEEYNPTDIDQPHATFDIITATNVLAHVPDPIGFLKAAKRHLNPDGIIVVEFTYGRNVLKNIEFDIIYHEHISHFTAKSISELANNSNLIIQDITEVPIHGGSLRVCFGNNTAPDSYFKDYHTSKLIEFMKAESDEGLYDLKIYEEFQHRVDHNIEELKNFLYEFGNDNLAIGFGASAKSSTILNYAKLNLKYICDDSHMKWGFFTPGMNIPIVPPTILKNEHPNTPIICTAWNFSAEIEEKISKIAQDELEVVYYCPGVTSNLIVPVEVK